MTRAGGKGALLASVAVSLAALYACVGDDPTLVNRDAGGGPSADASPQDGAIAASDDASSEAAAIDPVVSFATGVDVSCAVKASGAVLCWGANDTGQLGIRPETVGKTCSAFGRTAPCRSTPTVVPGIAGATQVTVSFRHVCALTTDGTVWCWGGNYGGQLGHDAANDGTCGSTKCREVPTQVQGLSDVAEVVASDVHTCARTNGGAVYCWGSNGDGLLGTGATGAPSSTPVAAAGLTAGVTKIATAGYSQTTCAIKSGEVYCWGISFSEGNLGHDPATDSMCTTVDCNPTPTKIAGITGAFDIALGERNGCAVVSGGAVKCWGSNGFGQLGAGLAAPTGYQVRDVPGLAQVVALSARLAVTCARTQDGEIHCWGAAPEGSLGDGDLDGGACTYAPCQPSPVKVPLTSKIVRHASGTASIVVDESGALFAWGRNGFGELGHDPSSSGDLTCGTGTCNPTPGLLTIP